MYSHRPALDTVLTHFAKTRIDYIIIPGAGAHMFSIILVTGCHQSLIVLVRDYNSVIMTVYWIINTYLVIIINYQFTSLFVI